jgi:ubiquinol-cytochrome c reductase iron-sulfur subunit
MADSAVDTGRRRFLTLTTAVVGGVGGVFAAVPFYSAFKPSARAVSAGGPVEVDISKLPEGAQLTRKWRKRPVWIIRRSKASLDGLSSQESRLRDPNSENKEQQPAYVDPHNRAIKPEVLVLVGSCTHLGCSPKFHPEMQPTAWDSEWKGGFYCPCHNSRFDMAGRVYDGVPAPTNLVVPPHRYVNDSVLIIGEDQEAA